MLPFSGYSGQAGWEAAGPRDPGDRHTCHGLSSRQAVPPETVWAAGESSHAWLSQMFPTPLGVPGISPVPHFTLLLFCPPGNPEQEVERGVETILRGLRGAEEESKMVIYLLALGNAALPETIPILLDHAEEGPTTVAIAAISALRRFPAQHISSKVQNKAAKAWCSKPPGVQNGATICTLPPYHHHFNCCLSSGETSNEEDFPQEEEEL